MLRLSPLTALLPALCVWVGAGARAASEPGLNPLASCPQVEQAPVVDGMLDDPVWAQGAVLGPLRRVGTGEEPSQRTTVRAVRRGPVLYLGFDCAEDRMGALTAPPIGRDNDRAWAHDCVHVFIAPADPREYYCHLTVTAANALHDEDVAEAGQDRSAAWDSRAETAVALGPEGWSCEIALPLTRVAELAPEQGSWSFNVSRAEQPHREWTSWAPLDAGFHEVDHFGLLRWDAGAAVTGLEIEPPFVGRRAVELETTGGAGQLVAWVEALRDQRHYPRGAVQVPEDGRLRLEYGISGEGAAAVRVIVKRPGEALAVCTTPPVSFRVPEAQRMLNRLTARLREVSIAEPGATPHGLTALRDELAQHVGALGEALAALRLEAPPARETWMRIADEARALSPRVRRLELLARQGGQPGEAGAFALGSETALRKVAPDDSQYRLSTDLRLNCARRERESAQLVVASLGARVEGVQVEWGDLRGPHEARLARECVTISQAGFVTTRAPDYPVERVGRWPDPLLPLRAFDVPAGEVQPLWVTVSIPPGTAPGPYRGEITVRDAAGHQATARLEVEVWDLELPLHGRFRTGFGTVMDGDIREWFGFQGAVPMDVRRRLEGLLLANRANPAGLYQAEAFPPPEDLEWCRERGLNAWCLGDVTFLGAEQLVSLTAAARKLRDAGLLDLAYVISSGETDPESMRATQETYRAVRRLIPGLRRASLMAPNADLWGLVNVWGPVTSDFDARVAQSRLRAGEETWWTVCCGPRHPYGNLFIDYPAIDARALMWAAHKYGVTGFLYYEVAMWASNLLPDLMDSGSVVPPEDPAHAEAIRSGKRWPQVPWNTFTFSRYNGDGQLVYPWGDGDFLPSLRLEVLRDGIEDYELLALLHERALALQQVDGGRRYGQVVSEAMQLAGVRDAIVRHVAHYNQDPGVLLAERQKVLREATRLGRLLERQR